jgi:type III restriction enzyme
MAGKSPIEEEFLGYDIPEFGYVDPTKKPEFSWVRSPDKKILRENGRRKSPELCVNQIRAAVDEWRDSGYSGGSATTIALFHWWFEQPRHLAMFDNYRPYWVQREAIETIVYLLEVKGIKDVSKLIQEYGKWVSDDLLQNGFEIKKNMDGVPQLITQSSVPLDLPQENLPRFAIKAATGSGKTMVMAYLIFWSAAHARREKGSEMANNFLLLAPNVIVFERLRKDFEGGKIFADLDMSPAGWANPIQVILRGESIEPSGKNTLVLTNVQQLHDDRTQWNPKNPLDKILGRAPIKGAKNGRHILERVRGMKRLMVLNDEAHHVHDDDLKWNQILLDLHSRNGGLIAWLDFSATPNMQNGTVFPWVVTDYPLAQAVEHQIVKFPVLVQNEGKAFAKPEDITKDNAIEKYGAWIKAGVDRLRAHEAVYGSDPVNKPVMFIMCENVNHAEKVGEWLRNKKSGFKFNPEEILIIHTKGDNQTISESELTILRDQANTIDSPASPIKVVVSVLVLREGWDVRNVTIVLGLRPGTAKANILPEQAVGRGLRLMPRVAGTQVLEIIGTPAFHDLVKGLEAEGVILGESKKKVEPGVMISPTTQRKNFDISIPRTSSVFSRNYLKIDELDPTAIPPSFTQKELLAGVAKMRVSFWGLHGGGMLGDYETTIFSRLATRDSLAIITQEATRKARLTDDFNKIYPLLKKYVSTACFETKVDIESEEMAVFLSDILNREKIAKVFAKALGDLVSVKDPVKIEGKPIKLSATKPFLWNRKRIECKKTIFNFVPVWNDFEGAFAEFLDHAPDVTAFSALAEYNTEFFVDYQKPSGALGQYFPDWVVKIGTGKSVKYWIIETKGRVWEGTAEKDAAVQYWCEQVSEESEESWMYVRVNQAWWNKHSFGKFAELISKISADPESQDPLFDVLV